MNLSRRRLLFLTPAVAALTACGLPRPRPRVNVRDFGAVGDGNADDAAAITAATGALRSGQTLHFPPGQYRFAQLRPPGKAAIALSGMSDVAVDFALGAELVMDNLDAGLGTSHGIVVRGSASGITLRNVRIRWATPPAQRSFGDGIRVVGFPGDSAPPADWTGSTGSVSGVRILDCEVRSSPQAGVIMMGVSDIRVDGLVVRDTLADGLHFNACRRAVIRHHRAHNAGDDGLALVTYYSDTFAHNNVAETFALPALTEWSDADFVITDVTVAGGRANGVRVAGANGVRIRGLSVSGKESGSGFMADSAAPGVDAGWFYQASRGVRVSRVRIEDCDMGLHLLARPPAAPDARFTDFDVAVTGSTIRGCRTWGVRAESLTAQPATGLRLGSCAVEATAIGGGNGGVGLQNVGDTQLGRVSLTHPAPVTVFSAIAATELSVEELSVAITDTTAEAAAEPVVSFQDCSARIDTLRVRWPDAPGSWQPVRISAAGDCAAVAVTTLTVDPDIVTDPIARCG